MASTDKGIVPSQSVDGSGATAPKPRRQTYGQIIKSSAVIGGSSVLNLGIGMIRGKAMAHLLGPAGVGLMGACDSLIVVARTLAGLGISNSGVRQIAEAAGTGDEKVLSRTVMTLRRVAFLLGILGALLLIVLCQPLSRYALKNNFTPLNVAFLALAVFFGALSAGQVAVIQGTRRIKDLAFVTVLGPMLGTVTAVPIVWFFYYQGNPRGGIIPALISVAATAALVSWWYSRRIRIEPVEMRWADLSSEVSILLKLGFVFMTSALISTGVAALVRIILIRKLDETAAGYYQSAWVLGGYYVGFILQAMGADFFPRLTAVAKENAECNRLVNEQAEVSLLLAGPGVLATLTFAPWVILIFYTRKFGPSVEILRWICLGMMLRVVSWPMGFILLAKGARKPFFWTELASGIVQVLLVWFGVRYLGLKGTGIAFFVSYIFYAVLIYLVVRSVSGFRWSAENRKMGLQFALTIALTFVGWYFVDRHLMVLFGAIATAVSGFFSLKKLCQMVPPEKLPKLILRLAGLFKFLPKSQKDSPDSV